MKYTKKLTTCFILLIAVCLTSRAQLYKIELKDKVRKASLIVEGKVTDQYSFWNDEHTTIFTSNKVHIYKLFKGQTIDTSIEVLTLGGTVGLNCLKVSDVLQLDKGQKGMFFLFENAKKIRSPQAKTIYDVYSSAQGFLKYDRTGKKAFAPFAKYDNVQTNLYNLIKQQTGIQEKVIDNISAPVATQAASGSDVSNGTAAVVITSFSPATVHGGAINDDANNILTINGSGFENNPSGEAAVFFKDGNNDNIEPDFAVPYNSPYIISWTDKQIKLHVPDRAGTGKISVTASDGKTETSTNDLNVFFAVLDALFIADNGDAVIREPRLMNTNGNGGYSVKYSTSTEGKGVDFSTSPAKETFLRSLATWTEILGANIIEGGTTTQQIVKDDGVNLVVFDNNNTTQPNMADGVLESTYSWFSACNPNGTILVAQKKGFDIILRNNAVSRGDDLLVEDGPCFPTQGSYDLEMIILHEIGHALNLSHINDDLENGGGGYPTVNPSKLMHYAILDYVDRRSPDAAAYQGALYEITKQNNTYGNCSLYAQEMTPLVASLLPEDECPATFPSSPIADNTIINFDLIHATSNKMKDPSFEQVTCNGAGTSVTNNLYYAFSTGSKSEVALEISNYLTTPAELSSCAGQGVRLALYDVQTCPAAQSYPAPVICQNFNSNLKLNLTGLAENHKYLLYFDGIRNTKASFYVTFNPNSSNPGIITSLDVYPNPITTSYATVRIINTTGSFYEYGLFDAVGKHVSTGKITVNQSTQTFQVFMGNVAAGVYFLRLADENGNLVAKKKIIKFK